MTTMKANGTAPRPLAVGEEPPPLDADQGNSAPRRPGKPSRAKGERRRVVKSRFLTLNAFVDFTLRELAPAEVAVWLVLFRDSRNGLARTGQVDIARRAGICRKTVGRAIRRLAERGLLRVVRRGRLGSGPSSYRLRWLIPE
jgi:hypothetical protein